VRVLPLVDCVQIHPTLRVNVLLGVRRVHIVADVPVRLVLRKQEQLALQPLVCVMGLGGASTVLPHRKHVPVVMPPPSKKPSQLQESKQAKCRNAYPSRWSFTSLMILYIDDCGIL
jgi:hypothetical protein